MSCIKIYTYLCSWALFAVAADTATILAIMPVKAKSHFRFNEAVLESLVAAGHRVTIFSPFAPANTSSDFVHVNTEIENPEDVSPYSEFDFKSMPWGMMFDTFVGMWEADCYDIMRLPEMNELLDGADKRYDLMFLEMLPMYECYLPIAKKLQIPVIRTMSVRTWPNADLELGNPRDIATVPFLFSYAPKPMALYDRIQNWIAHMTLNTLYQFLVLPKVSRFYRTHFPSYVLENNAENSFIFANNHPSFEPRSSVPSVIDIGGIHLKSQTHPLPKRLNKFIEESKHGVILFTFGSITQSNSIGLELRNVFRDAFSEIPQRVIWKFEENIQNLSDNVLLMPWVPQEDILAHPNIKGFISHCGMLGTLEAINSGKPMIMIPVFVDQLSNAAFLNAKDVGVYLDISSLTKEKLVDAINAIVNDTKYHENMQQLSRVFKDRPMSLQDTVVYWTDYALRYNGSRPLRTAAADIPLYQYLLLDVLLFVTCSALIVSVALVFLLKRTYTFVCAIFKTFEPTIPDNKKNL